MKNFIFTLMLMFLCGTGMASAQEKKFSVYAAGFYNLENLFDTCHDSGKNDYEFLADGTYKWNKIKYTHKLRNMARVLSEMGTDMLPMSIGCAVIGVSEVENSRALDDLVAQEPLAKRGYKYCHIEGPDRRGVDCAMLYNPKLFKVRDVKLVPFVQELEKDSAYYTRGFLTVSGTMANEHVTVVVTHLPSRFNSSFYREIGGKQLKALKDSLIKDDPDVKVLIMGDMNDDPMDPSMAEKLGAKREIKDVGDGDMYNPWWNVLAKEGRGTLMYNGGWNLFDQIILSPSLLCRDKKKDYSTLKYLKNQIFTRDYLFQQEGKYKGNPKRTHAGGSWLDGYSDHLPTIVYLVKEQK
ncbi:MAG: endonuclease/exonuclease/phosphatase family protein [Prevotella sp.]|nr:endonuclease/exonuclease/phosphatase family protein [Prevotella sp.]